MKLQQPFSGYFRISQLFGENLNGFYRADGLLGHTGIDFACPMGTPIISPCNGQVIFVSTDIQKGEGVTILSDDTFDFHGQPCKLSCIMWHLKDQSIKVKVGDRVKIGDLLALSNNTGQSTGAHLHFSVCPLASDGSRRELAVGNGYRSCVDPLPYLDYIANPIIFSTFQHTWNMPQDRIKAFQTKNGLTPDGIVGPKTQAVIDQLI